MTQHAQEIEGLSLAIKEGLNCAFDAVKNFTKTLMNIGGISEDDAGIVFHVYAKNKVLKFDRVNRTYRVKHGALLDKEIILKTLKDSGHATKA